MLVIGITGGVGAGKSMCLQTLKEHCNCKILLADDVGNMVKEPGQKCYSQIVDLLGEDILHDIEKERKNGQIDVFFLEAALLIEAGYVPYLDELWYIYTEKSVRIKRLKESRSYSDEKIEQIMNKQLSDEEFRKYADFVLDNSHNFDATFAQIENKCKCLGLWND